MKKGQIRDQIRTRVPAGMTVFACHPLMSKIRMDALTEYDQKQVIYFLIKTNKVIYIGVSSNLECRLRSHHTKKDFDAVGILELTLELVEHHFPQLPKGYLKDAGRISQNPQNWRSYWYQLESDYIGKYQPRYNKVINTPTLYNPRYKEE